MIKLPGLIDPHVHLRDPGQTHKEDFTSGTMAALAGGFTTVIDMPNNLEPIITLERLKGKQKIAKYKIVSDVGFYFGSLGDNLEEFPRIYDKVLGLKLYLNQTTGNYLIDKPKLKSIMEAWESEKPILLHAEEDILEDAISIAAKLHKTVHICHISSESELSKVLKAKNKGIKITCGVTPHHLFLTAADGKKLGPFGLMKPILKSPRNQGFLWENLKDIDIIESDHAPHTLKEKQSKNPPFGVPNLETTLPLLLTAVHQGKLEISDIKRLCYTSPSKIFGINQELNTFIEVEENKEWIVDNKKLQTKCGWSPFDGLELKGQVRKVVVRGKTAYEDGKVLVKPGFGRVL